MLELITTQNFTSFTTEQAINPITTGVDSKVTHVWMVVSNTGSNDLRFVAAGESQGVVIGAGKQAMIPGPLSSADGLYGLVAGTSTTAEVAFFGPPTPAF